MKVKFDVSLFNSLLPVPIEALQHLINDALVKANKPYQLTITELKGLAEERKQLFEEHQIVDFSWASTESLALFLSSEALFYKGDYLAAVSVCQAIFYYLREYHTGQVTDHEILEAIEARYENCEGNLELLMGSFEDDPELEG